MQYNPNSMSRLSVLLVFSWLALAQTPAARRIDALLRKSSAAVRTHWGIEVVDLRSGKPVYRRNAGQYFVPASNTKLFSTALALTRLGPDHRMHTLVLADAAPDSSGTLQGGLRLCGGGDTTLSGREIPYRKDARPGDPLQAIEALADQVAARGVRRIEGDIVGDDTAYVWAPYAEGWGMDDAVWEYGAPVSALVVNDNAFTLTLRPGARAGDPATIALEPPFPHFAIHNLAQTAAGGGREIHLNRRAGSREIEIWGRIPAGDPGIERVLALEDPALYAAEVLRDALLRRGVTVTGRAVARHLDPSLVADPKSAEPEPPPGGVELARRTSPPLVEMLRVADKISQNLHAEVMLREVGRVRRNIGSREAGLEELKALLGEAGAPQDGYSIHDGSGLSRLNLLTPETVVKLLAFMERSRYRDQWIGLLPVGGEDGTLSARFQATAAAGRVRAKTGTMTHVSALSGYLDRRDGRRYAFSIFANNYHAKDAEIRGLIDRIVNLLVD